MEGQEQETIEQPAEIYDMDKSAYVPNPALTEETTTEEKEETETEEEETTETETSTEEQETTEETEETEESTEEGTEKEESKEAEDVLEPDAFFAEMYSEKYGIKTQAEMEELIESAIEAQTEHETLKKENETLKANSGKAKFDSDKEEKAFEFIKKFDINRQGEALDTYAKLISMDVDGSDPMMVLEERYIHEHPEWNRADAQRMFQKDYKKRFTLDKDRFEGTEEEYNSEVADMAIMKRGEVERAKTYLKDQQAKYKPQASEDKPLVSEVVTKSIEKIVPEYTAHADKTNEITFEQDGEKYIFKLDADKKSKVNAAVKEWVKNPSSYSKDGKLMGVKTPDEMMNIVIGGMYMKDIIKAVADQVKNSVSIKRVDEIGKVQPKKRSAIGSGDAKLEDNLYAQAQALIKKKKAA